MGAAGWILCTLVVLFLVAPLAVIGVLAFSGSKTLTFPPPSYSTRWFHDLTSDPQWTGSMGTSFRLALTSTALGLLFGVPLALGLSRGKIGRFRAVQGIVAAPLIVPVVSTAIGFYFVSARLGVLDSLLPLIVAHVTFGLPLIVVTVLAADRGIDPWLEPAARTLGASFGRTLLRVTLPLIAPGIAAGAVFAFLTSWDDIVNAVFLGTARVRPFPLKLWNEMQFTLSPVIAAAAVLMSAVSLSLVAVLAIAYRVRRNRMSRQVAENIVLRAGGS
jgi:putative spermidine/putrescine transport system permease protein